MYLWTCPEGAGFGPLFVVSPWKIAEVLRLDSVAEANKVINDLVSAGWIEYDHDVQLVWLPRQLEEVDLLDNKNVLIGMIKKWRETPRSPLQQRFLDAISPWCAKHGIDLPEIRDAVETPSERRRDAVLYDVATPDPDPEPEPEPEPEKKKKIPASAVAEPPTDHKVFNEFFCRTYEERFAVPYDFERGKDGKHVKDLLAKYGLEKLKAIAEKFLTSDDPFLTEKTGFTLSMLRSQINRHAVQALGKPKAVRARDFMSQKQTADNIEQFVKESRDGVNRSNQQDGGETGRKLLVGSQ
jgi:hypothetical protein